MFTLIFTGGEAPSFVNIKKFFSDYKLVNELKGIICADSGVDTLIAFQKYMKEVDPCINLYPDIILGDMDSVSSSYKDVFTNSQFIPFNCDKDYTDTELALEIAYDKYPECKVILIGGDGGRSDHFLQIVDDFSNEKYPSVWLLTEQIIYYLKPSVSYVIKGLKETDNVSFMRLLRSYNEGSVESKGLKWEGDLFRKTGMASISNRIDLEKGNEVSIFVKDAPFLLFLPYGANLEIA